MSKTSPDAKARWNSKAYDSLCIYVKKGKKGVIQKRAAEVVPNGSLNGYINKLIDKDLEEADK